MFKNLLILILIIIVNTPDSAYAQAGQDDSIFSFCRKTDTIALNNFGLTDLFISQSYPNPAEENVNIDISSSNNGNVEIYIFNLLGENAFKTELYLESGVYTLILDVSGFESGIYFFKVEKLSEMVTRKMIIK